jgi:hypothetical protein
MAKSPTKTSRSSSNTPFPNLLSWHLAQANSFRPKRSRIELGIH